MPSDIRGAGARGDIVREVASPSSYVTRDAMQTEAEARYKRAAQLLQHAFHAAGSPENSPQIHQPCADPPISGRSGCSPTSMGTRMGTAPCQPQVPLDSRERKLLAPSPSVPAPSAAPAAFAAAFPSPRVIPPRAEIDLHRHSQSTPRIVPEVQRNMTQPQLVYRITSQGMAATPTHPPDPAMLGQHFPQVHPEQVAGLHSSSSSHGGQQAVSPMRSSALSLHGPPMRPPPSPHASPKAPLILATPRGLPFSPQNSMFAYPGTTPRQLTISTPRPSAVATPRGQSLVRENTPSSSRLVSGTDRSTPGLPGPPPIAVTGFIERPRSFTGSGLPTPYETPTSPSRVNLSEARSESGLASVPPSPARPTSVTLTTASPPPRLPARVSQDKQQAAMRRLWRTGGGAKTPCLPVPAPHADDDHLTSQCIKIQQKLGKLSSKTTISL